MILPHNQNTVAVCNQIPLILYYICSQLVTLLKIIDAHIQASDICDLIDALKFINCSFQIFLIFVLEMSADFTSYNVCLCQACTCWCEEVCVCETQLTNMDFNTSSFQLLMQVQFCNSLLLSHRTFFHSACRVVLPGERILVVCKFNFPYHKYLIWIPLLIVLFPPNFHDLSRIAANVTVPQLVCLPYPPFPSSCIALSGVC
jgi:hypothetical protein